MLCFALQVWTVSQVTIPARNLSKVSYYACDNEALSHTVQVDTLATIIIC